MDHQINISECLPKISFSVEKSIVLEFDQLLGNLRCRRTMSNEQEQKDAHQENCRLWVRHENWIMELIEINGQLPHSRPPFYL